MKTHENSIRTRIDWEAVRGKVEASGLRLENPVRTPDERERILADRARLLSVVKQEIREEEMCSVLIFETSGDSYAVESSFVREVFPIAVSTRIPNTPDFVLGVTGIRGEILSLVDLTRFLELPRTASEVEGLAIRLATQEMELALRVRSVMSVETVPVSAISRPPKARNARAELCVRGFLKGGSVMIDASRLLSREHIGVGYLNAQGRTK